MKKEYPVDVVNYPYQVIVPVQLRFTDIDGFGHANNSAMQAYFDLGRAAYLQKICGFDFYRHNETMLVVSYTTDFLKQVYFEDNIEMCVAVYKIGTNSLRMIMSLRNASSHEVCAVSDCVMAGFNKLTQKSMPILPEWRKKISDLENKVF